MKVVELISLPVWTDDSNNRSSGYKDKAMTILGQGREEVVCAGGSERKPGRGIAFEI